MCGRLATKPDSTLLLIVLKVCSATWSKVVLSSAVTGAARPVFTLALVMCKGVFGYVTQVARRYSPEVTTKPILALLLMAHKDSLDYQRGWQRGLCAAGH